MPSPLADRTYRHLFSAQFIALAGTGLTTVALALLAYDLWARTPAPCWAPRWRSRWSPMSASRRWSAASPIGCRAAAC